MFNISLLIIMGTVLAGVGYFLVKPQVASLLANDDDDIERDGNQQTRIRHGNM